MMTDGPAFSNYRRMPHNIEAERGLLGAIFLDNARAIAAVEAFLLPEHFALRAHGRVYEACLAAYRTGKTANPHTLHDRFAADGDLDELGGPTYLLDLLTTAITVINAGEYGRIIHDCHLRCRIIEAAEQTAAKAADPDLHDTAASLIANHIQAIEQINNKSTEGRTLGIINPTQWEGMDVEPRQWLVPNWIPWSQTTSIYGDGGVGKSTLAMQLQVACATGMPWCGVAPTKCKSIGFYCEDQAEELHRRLHAIAESYDVSMRHLSEMALSSRVGEDTTLMRFDVDGTARLTETWYDIRRQAIDAGANLIILDTLTDIYGGNEIDRAQVNAFVKLCLTKLAVDIDGAVVVTGHPSLTGIASGSGHSGSTHWHNAVRSRLYLRRPDDDQEYPMDTARRILESKKSNYAAQQKSIDLRWVHGAFVPERATHPQNVVDAIDAQNIVRDVVDGIRMLRNRGMEPAVSAQARNLYAPRMLKSAFPDLMAHYNIKKIEQVLTLALVQGVLTLETVAGGGRRPKEIYAVPRQRKPPSEETSPPEGSVGGATPMADEP